MPKWKSVVAKQTFYEALQKAQAVETRIWEHLTTLDASHPVRIVMENWLNNSTVKQKARVADGKTP